MGLLTTLTLLGVALAGTVLADPIADARLDKMEQILKSLGRQVMLQQFYTEEKIRTDGNSGLKATRLQRSGTKNYFQATISADRFSAIHDHAFNARTLGMGELQLVMNGVDFRTRHNDYKLRMPSTTSTDYHQTEDIAFPEVPPSVLAKPTVEEQIVEMREYFKAFKNQDPTHRDYRPYFKANLCYVEGAWTLDENLDEPFQSDRHFLDAESWDDLMDKVRYNSYKGGKSTLENLAFLPKTIMNVTNDGQPKYAQWNYRILCHPLKDDLPTENFHLENDLSYRLPHRLTLEQVRERRAARFFFNEEEIDHYNYGQAILDFLMAQIPGKDNYPVQLHDNSDDRNLTDRLKNDGTPLNTGYYHRYYKTAVKGAMGIKLVSRGFADTFLFVAQNTQPRVAGLDLTKCVKIRKNTNCQYWTSKYSYALPLEVVYTTPLHRWNPRQMAEDVDEVTIRGSNGKRNGAATPTGAYDGTNEEKFFYKTPVEFYNDADEDENNEQAGVAFLNKKGEVHTMAASGIRIITPTIQDVGRVRLRYPILPTHGEGSAVWKELNALKDITMYMDRLASLYIERPMMINSTEDIASIIHYQMQITYQDPPGEHTHDFYLNVKELDEIKNGNNIMVSTSVDMGHSHELELQMGNKKPILRKCDGKKVCWDGHGKFLTVVE